MKITNFGLLKFRVISPVIASVFAIAVYLDVKEFFMFPLCALQVASLVLATKLKCKNKERSLVVISQGRVVFLVILYVLTILLGFMVAIKSANAPHSVALACFYVVCLDAFMAIPFVLSFTDKTKWQSSWSGPGFGADSSINSANGQALAGYTNPNEYLPGRVAPSWPVDSYTPSPSDEYDVHTDFYTSVVSGDSFDINPATGQTMVGIYDTSGCLYGYSDPVFTNDHHTSQFSDFYYHNNS